MPKIVDQEAYRRKLATKATRLFGERGYGSLSMRELAKGLGVSAGTLYHYFPSKQKVFEAAVRVVFEGQVAAALDASRSGEQQLRLEVRDIFGFLVAQEERVLREFIVLVDYWRLHPEDRGELAPVLKEAHDSYAEVVSRLLGVDDHGVGELVLSALFNILEMRWFHGSGFDHEPQMRLLEKLVRLERAVGEARG